MELLQIIIETERLLLAPISLAHKEDAFREFTPEITTYMFPKPADTLADTEAFINTSVKNMQDGKELVCAILKKETKEYLGTCGLHRINEQIPELGIWIKKSAHGNKYGREAMTALKQWADEYLEYDHITYPVDKDNIPSRKIPESMGGVVMREFDSVNMSGNTLHEVEYWIYPTKKNAYV